MWVLLRNARVAASAGNSAAVLRVMKLVVGFLIVLPLTLVCLRGVHALDCTRAVTTTERLLCREQGGTAAGADESAKQNAKRQDPDASAPANKIDKATTRRRFSASDVWFPRDTAAWLGTLIQCDWNDACISRAMATAGATAGAIEIARSQEFNGYLSEFEEHGRVDTGRVRLEYANRPGSACYVLNGSPPLIDVGAELTQDPELAQAIKAHPQFDPLQWSYQDRNPDDKTPFRLWPQQTTSCTASPSAQGQEVRVGVMMGGCEDCATGGHAQIALDFDRKGRLLGRRLIGLSAEAPTQWASTAAAEAPKTSPLNFPADRPALQARQDVGAVPLQTLFRRVAAERALDMQNSDACEQATLHALSTAEGQDLSARDGRTLAADILQAATGRTSVGSSEGDFLLALGAHLARSAMPGASVSEEMIRLVTEQTGAYVAGKAVAGYLAGGATEAVSEALVTRLLRDDGVTAWTLDGSNAGVRVQGTDSPRASNVTAQVLYNPYTRYMTAVIGAGCTTATGAPDRRLYRLQCAVAPDTAQSADYVPGTVAWQEIIAGP
jgi:hypothetical protein